MGRGRYLRSMFARHPWHAPFSLKEDTREMMSREPELGPEASALEAWPARTSVGMVGQEAAGGCPVHDDLLSLAATVGHSSQM